MSFPRFEGDGAHKQNLVAGPRRENDQRLESLHVIFLLSEHNLTQGVPKRKILLHTYKGEGWFDVPNPQHVLQSLIHCSDRG
jgi:hypothetical protein